VNWPDVGVGIIASYRPTKKIYIMGGLTDVRGDLFTKGEFLSLGENFFDGNFFKTLEVGYVPSFGMRYFQKISLTYWRSDGYNSASGSTIAKGEGIAFSAHWLFKEKYAPYFRMGFSNGMGENAFYKRDIQIGNGFRFKTHDLLGIGLSWNEPNIPDVKNQVTAEIYYRFNLTEHLEITPDFQFIFNPTLNPSVNSITYWGIRARVTL